MRIPVLTLIAPVLLAAVPAMAQVGGTTELPPNLGPATPPPAAASTAVTGNGSGKSGVGVGATSFVISGFPGGGLVGGPSVAYDAGLFHIDSFFTIAKAGSGSSAAYGLGGRFWWHLHARSSADFSVGGGLAFAHNGNNRSGGRDFVYIEPGVQLRAFIVSNVAISGTVGLSIATADGNGYFFGSTGLLGGVGLHYYFY